MTSLEAKPYVRYFYGWKRRNVYREKVTDPQSIMHEITPCSNASISCLCYKIEALFGSIFLPARSDNISPLVQLLIFRQMASDYISPGDFKMTDYKRDLITDITYCYKNKNKSQYQKKVEAISKTVDTIFRQVFEKGDQYLMTVEDKNRSINRIEYLMRLKRAEEARAQECMKKVKAIVGDASVSKEMEVWGTDELLQAQFDIAMRMEMLTYGQQIRQLKHFAAFHQRSFNCQLKKEKQNNIDYCSFYLNRPSANNEPVLMRLSEMVLLREQDHDYSAESHVMIADLLDQVKKYHLDTSDFEQGVLSFYQWLSPQSVLFDQISLRLKLSYDPLLINLLGLRKRPVSLESHFVWFCTPKEFDYFQGEAQMDEKVQLQLADPFYGTTHLYRTTNLPMQAIKRQRQENARTGEEICVDRFLLTSHYLLFGKEFGRPQTVEQRTSYKKIKQYFKPRLIAAKEEARNEAANLKVWLGETASRFEGEFVFGLSELVELMAVQEKDSLVETQRFQRIVKYLNLRYQLLRQILAILSKQERFFNKIANSKKYIMLFYSLAIQCLEELRLLSLEGPTAHELPQLSSYIESNGKKLSNGRSAEHSMKGVWEKIENYRQRSKSATEVSNRYLQQEQGKKHLTEISRINETLTSQRSIIKDVIATLESRPRKQGYRQKVRKDLQEARKQIGQALESAGRMLSEFVRVEIRNKYANGPHKLPEMPTELITSYYGLASKRFELIIHSFITANPQRFLEYEALVQPLLHMDEPTYYPSLTDQRRLTPEFIKAEKDGLNMVDKIVEFSKPVSQQQARKRT